MARIEPLGIESEGLTQVEAGEHFGVSQPRISNLVRGRIEEFTIDSLVNMLSHAGIRTDVVVSPDR
ncbi:MAG: helix-turn-helix domain-containing protein [Gemmatimonadota bacterium]